MITTQTAPQQPKSIDEVMARTAHKIAVLPTVRNPDDHPDSYCICFDHADELDGVTLIRPATAQTEFDPTQQLMITYRQYSKFTDPQTGPLSLADKRALIEADVFLRGYEPR